MRSLTGSFVLAEEVPPGDGLCFAMHWENSEGVQSRTRVCDGRGSSLEPWWDLSPSGMRPVDKFEVLCNHVSSWLLSCP